MSDFLFDEFDTVSAKEWKQKIQVDLKGADYNDSLLWNTDEGVVVKPYYTKEDRTFQKVSVSKRSFAICQTIHINDEVEANRIAVDVLQRGAKAISFVSDKKFDIQKLLLNIDVTSTVIYFNLSFLSKDFIQEVLNTCTSDNVYFNIDIIGSFAKSGNWFSSLKEDLAEVKEILKISNSTICVDASLYQNAGANIVQQLSYALAHANEYLNLLGREAAQKIYFKFAVGGNYFFEIAKLRAFRLIWQSLLNEYEVSSSNVHLFVEPSLRNKTLYDYNVNMLRTTSECMSAVLGGANTVANVSYDALFHKPNEFGERISRNQLLILQEESYFASAQNYAEGAYYIESITNQLAEKALEVFKLIEQGGGFLKQLNEGVIQRKIKESAVKEQQKFDSGELVLLGTNAIQNPNDAMKNDLEVNPFLQKRSKKTIIEPIIQKRLAEALEQDRLNNE